MPLRVFLSCAFAVCLSQSGLAQDSGTQIATTVAGLLSIQPTDDAYVGSTYLDRGLGGVGPGVLAGLNFRFGRHVVTAVEYTRGWIAVDQTGRIVGGSAPGEVHDSMLSGLVGGRFGSARTTTDVLGGISQLLDTPTSDGEALDSPDWSVRRQVFTLGLDIATHMTSRVSFIATARGYLNVDRSEPQREVGLGRQILRVGAGLRIALRR